MRFSRIATSVVPLGLVLLAAAGCGGEVRTTTEVPPPCPTNTWCVGSSQCQRVLPACPGQAGITQTCTCVDDAFTCPAAPPLACPPPSACDGTGVGPGLPCAPQNAGRSCPGPRNPECPEEPAVMCTCSSNKAYFCPPHPECITASRDAGTDR